MKLPGNRLMNEGRRLSFFEACFEFVTFFFRDIEVEHEIFHIQTKLCQCFLDQSQNASAAFDGFYHAGIGDFQFQLVLPRQLGDLLPEVNDFPGQAGAI